MKIIKSASHIKNLDQVIAINKSPFPEGFDCFFRAMLVQLHESHRFEPRFGMASHWEEIDGKFYYNPIWQEHVWFVEKATGDLYDSHKAIESILNTDYGIVKPANFDAEKDMATVISLGDVHIDNEHFCEIDKLRHSFNSAFLYIEGSYASFDMADADISLRDLMAEATRNNQPFDYGSVIFNHAA